MPRHDPNQITKLHILETAMRLFSEKGMENVNIEDVVKKVGVTRGAFYHYFESREELIYCVLYKAFESNNPYIEAEKQKDMNALEKLRFIVKQSLRPNLEASASMRAHMKKIASNPLVFKNETIFQVTLMAFYVEKLFIEGNIDGSLSVTSPKQASQVIAWLAASWLDPYKFEVTYEEYVNKVLYFEQITNMLGVPLMDQEVRETYLKVARGEFE